MMVRRRIIERLVGFAVKWKLLTDLRRSSRRNSVRPVIVSRAFFFFGFPLFATQRFTLKPLC